MVEVITTTQPDYESMLSMLNLLFIFSAGLVAYGAFRIYKVLMG